MFFSHELCARYFTYMSREAGPTSSFFDDRDTLRKKLEVAQELGITSAVAALPEVLDAAGELRNSELTAGGPGSKIGVQQL